MTSVKSVSVFGLGKLGACIAATMSAKGINTVGVDTDASKVAFVDHGVSPIFEPGLDEMMSRGKSQLSATEDADKAVFVTDASFIVVPTPSEASGRFSLKYVKDAASKIGEALRKKNKWHLVALISTVMPKDTESEIIPILEATSGKRCGIDFGVCYSPEFIALGSVLQDFLNPDFVLIGESDKKAGTTLSSIYELVCDTSPVIQRMNLINAELSKLAVNTYVTTKVSFANTIAALCEQVPGADVDAVTNAVGLDTRIGRRYLTGGAPYGGPCFPRDVAAMICHSHAAGVSPFIYEATAEANLQHAERLVNSCLNQSSNNDIVGILGLAYKSQTNVLEESTGMFIAMKLAAKGRKIAVHDPLAMEIAKDQLHEYSDRIIYCQDSESCIQTSDVVVVTIALDQYARIPAEQFARKNRSRIVIDCWRLYRDKLPIEGVTYSPIGLWTAQS